MIRKLFASLLLATLVCIPASAMETKCVVTGPAGSYLADIARVAAGAQNQAEEMEAYLRNSSEDRLPSPRPRSEEHTSELQSHLNLVCRLLLEKKQKCLQY